MSKKVLQIVADGSPGGGTTFVLGLCQDIMKYNKWEPTLVTQEDSYAIQQAQRDNIKTHGLDFFKSRFDRTLPIKILAIINQVKPDLIHVHGSRAALPFCLSPLRSLDIPLVYTVHGYHFQKKPFPLNLAFLLAEHCIARRADHIVFVSRGDQKIAEKYHLISSKHGRNRSSIIHNGISPNDFDQDYVKVIETDILFLGRMHRQKNPLFMVDVMEHLRESNIRLRMVGGGPLLEELKKKIARAGLEEQISCTGPVSRSESVQHIKSTKIYIQPSLWEGLPITPIEASFCGVPIIASDIAGTDEIVENGKNGFLLNRFDPKLYAYQIKELLNAPERRRQMGEAGQRIVQERFLRETSSTSYQKVYDTLTYSEEGNKACF